MVSYDDIANLIRAFTGADAVAFISASDALAGRRRREQHANVVEACKEANVHRIIYSPHNPSVGSKDINDMSAIDSDYANTERLIKESGLVWNFQGDHFCPHEAVSGVECREGAPFSTDVAEEQKRDTNKNWELVLGALLLGRAHSDNGCAMANRKAVDREPGLPWDTRNIGDSKLCQRQRS